MVALAVPFLPLLRSPPVLLSLLGSPQAEPVSIGRAATFGRHVALPMFPSLRRSHRIFSSRPIRSSAMRI
jgi:hypothetical protein